MDGRGNEQTNTNYMGTSGTFSDFFFLFDLRRTSVVFSLLLLLLFCPAVKEEAEEIPFRSSRRICHLLQTSEAFLLLLLDDQQRP
jgi:hypothetical protein